MRVKTTTAFASNQCSLLIVEDDPMVQAGLARILDLHDFNVLQTASDGQSGVKYAQKLKPDLVVMNIVLPKLDGGEVIRQIKTNLPNTEVVILTSHTEKNQVYTAFASGAKAYCVKGTNIDQLIAAINTVRSNSIHLDPKIAHYFLPNIEQQLAPEIYNYDLSKRELEVLKLIAQGMNNSQIGRELNLSPNTIKGYVRQILAKLAVDNRINAAVKAQQLGLV